MDDERRRQCRGETAGYSNLKRRDEGKERKEEEEKKNRGEIDFRKRIKFFIESRNSFLSPYYSFYDRYISFEEILFYHRLFDRLTRDRYLDFRGGAGKEKPQGRIEEFFQALKNSVKHRKK